MNNLNSVLVEGNMVRDPLFKTIENGTAVYNFSIASNCFYKRGEILEKETSYFDVESWAKTVEYCRNLGREGGSVRVVGRLKQSRWTDAGGKTRSRVVIVAEHIEFHPESQKKREEEVFTEEAMPF